MSLFQLDNIISLQEELYPSGPIVEGGLSFQIAIPQKEIFIFDNMATNYIVPQQANRADSIYRQPNSFAIEGIMAFALIDGNPVSVIDLLPSLGQVVLGVNQSGNILSTINAQFQTCANSSSTFLLSTTCSQQQQSISIKHGELERNSKMANCFLVRLFLEEVIVGSAPITNTLVSPSASRDYAS